MLGFALTRPTSLAASMLVVAGFMAPASFAQQARRTTQAPAPAAQVQWSPYRDDAIVQRSVPQPARPATRQQVARQQVARQQVARQRAEQQASVEFEAPPAAGEQREQYEQPAQAQPTREIGTGLQTRRYAARQAGFATRPQSNLSARPYGRSYAPSRMSPTVGHMHTHYAAGPEVIEELPGQPGMPVESYHYDGQGGYVEGEYIEGEYVDGEYIDGGYVDGGYIDGGYVDGGMGEGYGGGYAGGGFGRGGFLGNNACCGPCICLPPLNLCNLEIFAGVHGFTSSANRGGTSSFGFHEGVNWGTPLFWGLAGQAGVNVTHSNFNGSPLTANDRTQTFVTLGGFRRVDWGLQGGLVIDYLNDNWDYNADLSQIRGELSWKFRCNHEFGFWFATSTNQATSQAAVGTALGNRNEILINQQQVTLQSTDLYAFFYRRQFGCGGQGRAFAGFTGSNQGILGADCSLPISPCFSLQSDFIYLTSSDRNDGLDYLDESWNVSLSVVWTPFGARGCQPCGPNYSQPLFNVANNNSFIPRLITGTNED